jgi:hypothetical protein
VVSSNSGFNADSAGWPGGLDSPVAQAGFGYGGGRIAIHYRSGGPPEGGTFTAYPGTGGYGGGQTGTVVWVRLPPIGSVMMIR